MRKSALQRALALLMTFIMVFSVCGINLSVFADEAVPPAAKTVEAESGYQLMASNGGRNLYLNSETTNFYVEDISTGKRVYAFPEDTSDDTVAIPAYAIEMQAALVFTLWDPEKKMESRRNTKAASVNQGNFIVRTQDNGFLIDYELKSAYVSATLSVVLEDGELLCTVPAGSVKETNPERCLVLSIAVLPFMISGKSDTEGEIILPDGCGEILDFAATRASAEVYQKPIYGRNLSTTLTIEEKSGYDITCPYLVLHTPDFGILALPTGGAAVGYVNASPSGKQSLYANAYYSFQYRANDLAIIGDTASSNYQSTRIIDTLTYPDDLTVRFQFMFENATLGNLAQLYGEYLAAGSEIAEPANYSSIFDIYGFVNEKKSFLGFPYNTISVLSEAEDIIAFAKSKESDDIAVNLKNVTSDQQKYRLNTTLKPLSKVLNKSELKQLNDSGASVFVNTNPLTFRKNTFNANSFFSAAKTLYGMPIGLREYSESTHLVNRSVGKSYLLKYTKLPDAIAKLLKSAEKTGIDGMSSDELAAMSYHDYSSGGTLEDTRKAQQDACASIAEKTRLMLTNPFDYSMPYCSVLLDIPVYSSNSDLGSGSYPFLQMALGDKVLYAVETINLYRSPETLFLRALVTGSILHYSFVLSDTEPLIGSNLNFLYSANYASFEELVDEQVAAWLEVRKATGGSRLVDYTEADDIATAVFENGVSVTANFADKTYTINQ